MEKPSNSRLKINGSGLSWIIGAVAFVIFVVTLNHWITVASLPLVSKVTQWDWWSLNLQAPLFFILTYPIRWFPNAWQPIALNLFSALCSALTLVILARSVTLMPHDRTREQRQREQSEFSLLSIPTAWMPPIFAAAVCGLQLTFWEHATAATGESLNLLLFAYVVRCLLEYRIDPRDSWMFRFALVYGLATANNYGMIALTPAFLLAIIWIQGVRFFRIIYLLKMLGLSLLGMCLYLLLPLVEKIHWGTEFGFWELFRMELGNQKGILMAFPKYVILLCALTSLLPLAVIGFRWPSSFGDVSVVGNLLTTIMFRVLHGLFLIVCLWVLFDPPFSPRALGFGLPLLPLYYISALCVGYFSGYFLLICGKEPDRRHRHHGSGNVTSISRLLIGLNWLAFIGVPIGLFVQNYTRISANNGPYLRQLADNMVNALPSKGAFVLSDEPIQLLLLEAALGQKDSRPDYIFLDTRSLPYHMYQRTLLKKFPQRWPDVINNPLFSNPIQNTPLLQIFLSLARTNEIYFLNPPYNFFTEAFHPSPKGMVFKMTPYSRGVIANPAPTTEEIAYNQDFWNKLKPITEELPRFVRQSEKEMVITDAEYAARDYSRAANYWGVELQKANLLEEASQLFDIARKFNPENWVAYVNQEFNKNLRNNNMRPVELAPAIESKVNQKYRRWEDRLTENGIFDEPRFCNEMGENLANLRQPLIRLAAHQFLRLKTIDPANLDAKIWLANLYLKWPFPEKTLEVTKEMEEQQSKYPLSLPYQIEVVRLKAWAYASMTNVDLAVKLLREAQVKNPTVVSLPETLSQIYIKTLSNSKDPNLNLTNALLALDELLRLEQNNSKALLNKGAIHIQLKQFRDAINPLSQILQSDPKHVPARINRALAYLNSSQWELARNDYSVLLELTPSAEQHRIYYGLGESSYQLKDHKKAMEYFQIYLKKVPMYSNKPIEEESVAYSRVQTRMQELKGTP